MPDLQYFAPTSLSEAIALLSEAAPAARPLAGGTDLIVQVKERATRFPLPSRLVSLHRIPELQGIRFGDANGLLRIGAGVTMAEVAAAGAIRDSFAALSDGASVVGSFQTMNMATLGGNLCNAAPSADCAPPLLALDAQAVIAGPAGQRTVPLDQFFLGPGRTVLGADELLVEVQVPAPPPASVSIYRRHTPRARMDIAVVGVAVALALDGERIARARIALGAVAPTPIRARQAEAALEGQLATDSLFAEAASIAAAESRPISDLRGSAAFRRHLVRVIVERLLGEAAARVKGDK